MLSIYPVQIAFIFLTFPFLFFQFTMGAEGNKKRRERAKRVRSGREAVVKVQLIGDSKFRDFRVGPHLHIFQQTIRRSVLGAELVKFELAPKVFSFPGKSCKDSQTAATISRQVGELCSSNANQLVLVIFSMGGNGVFSWTGEQGQEEVDRELDAHQELLSQLLVNNRNLCILALAVLQRPRVSQDMGFLRAVNVKTRQNMQQVAKMAGGRLTFEDVGRTLHGKPHLFTRDGVHLNYDGTRAIMEDISQYLKTTVPLKFH